ncbi:ADP-ribosylglycohydrolase family protein [Peptacetobacter hiranonis]|uniref:ADP-ribosylglycohydrolase family protein n=1 Tax=Peptacetobacter hiranonis TaxID=89152 RepID=UPI0019177E8B|nr:ADP-ribosylglycohydrolase family protein [Peptacetobacter hiranonis]QQQ87600.1 ADP-ribosylglycohydrolase family protein [Peptacetobacter hiranonis]
MNKLLNRFKGCILGGAVGDALGYPIEFMSEEEIFSIYGKGGITVYNLNNGVAEISDNTQMILFTIDGLILSDNDDEVESIRKCYIDWANTQIGDAYLGIDGINKKFLDKLELVDFIEDISEKLYNKQQLTK